MRPRAFPYTLVNVRNEIYNGRILRLVILDNKWEVVEHASAVAVLVTDGAKVLGVRQQRVAVGLSTWEIPAGLIDPGEDPATAAAREVAEEVQLGGRLELVTRFYVSPGFTDEEVFLYELHEPAPAEGTQDPDEHLTPEWLDAREAWRAIRKGTLSTSGVTVVALQHVLAKLGANG